MELDEEKYVVSKDKNKKIRKKNIIITTAIHSADISNSSNSNSNNSNNSNNDIL